MSDDNKVALKMMIDGKVRDISFEVLIFTRGEPGVLYGYFFSQFVDDGRFAYARIAGDQEDCRISFAHLVELTMQALQFFFSPIQLLGYSEFAGKIVSGNCKTIREFGARLYA